MTRLCVACDAEPVRELPEGIPDGTDATWIEYASGQSQYCAACFGEVDL